MSESGKVYWNAITGLGLEVHGGGEDITLSIKGASYAAKARVFEQSAWDSGAFADSLGPLWPILIELFEILSGRKALVLSRTHVVADEEVARLNPGMWEEEARRIVVRSDRVAPRVWSGLHCRLELGTRAIEEGVLDLDVYLYSEVRTKEVDQRRSSEKKLGLASLIPELTNPVSALFELLAGVRAPIVRLYGPDWRDTPDHWYGTDCCSLQAVWHDDDLVVSDGSPNVIAIPRKV